MGREEEEEEEEGVRVRRASHYYEYIYNLFRVNLFHSDETFMCMHAQEVCFFQIRSKKKTVTKCNENKLFERITLKRKLSASPKNGNSPNKKK